MASQLNAGGQQSQPQAVLVQLRKKYRKKPKTEKNVASMYKSF